MPSAGHEKRTSDTIARLGLVFTAAGVIVGFVVALITWQQPTVSAHVALILSLTTALIGICLDLKVNAYALGKKLENISMLVALDQQISDRFEEDEFMRSRYRALKDELQRMSEGGYTVHELGAVYSDDIRHISRLNQNEILRSSCPMANEMLEDVLDQITDTNYQRSMQEHALASRRGVDVRRLYLFKNITMCPPNMLAHLKEITEPNHEVRVAFRDKLLADAGIDFLVFGNHTVSTGVLNIDTGLCTSTRVSKDREAVRDAILRFDAVWNRAHSLEEVEKILNEQRRSARSSAEPARIVSH